MGIIVFPPVITDKIAALIGSHTAAKFGIFLKEVPAKQRISPIPVTGDHTRLGRANDTLGNTRIPFVDMLPDKTDEFLFRSLLLPSQESKFPPKRSRAYVIDIQ